MVAEYDPGDNTDIDLVPENVRTNLGGIKTNQESVVAAAGIDQSGLVNNISRMDSDTEVIDLTHNIENGQIDRRSGSIMSTGHLVVDGEGLYQRNELELASNLGGQEGEDFDLDPGDQRLQVAAVHTSGVVDSLASSKTSEVLHGYTNNDEVQLSGVDQVFEQYAESVFTSGSKDVINPR